MLSIPELKVIVPSNEALPSIDIVTELANKHWGYVKSVLSAHDVDPKSIELAAHHYIQAFIHGYKHGAKDLIDIYDNPTKKGVECGKETNGTVHTGKGYIGTIKKPRKLGRPRKIESAGSATVRSLDAGDGLPPASVELEQG